MSKPIRVLFVCLGNICRSPMAEAVFAHKVELAGLSELIQADSAGTANYHIGRFPHRGTRGILTANGIETKHLGRQIELNDFTRFDMIVTMDDANYADVTSLANGPAKVTSFVDYAPQLGYKEVPDPYYTNNFEEVYMLVDAASDGLLKAIRDEHEI